jgi:general secretion pathway protein D
VGDFNTLANPRIRVRSRDKAKVLVGDKVPVVTTTAGQTGFVAESVSYLDVGLKLEVEPIVYPDDEVAIRVALEVSSVSREINTAGGSLAYQIGTRNAATMLRLRDGETQLLAGLISREDRTSASRVPGLGDLPVMGRLFSSQSADAQRTELVLAITPRVVRNVRALDASESEVWVGTEVQPRFRRIGARAAVSEPASAPGGTATPATAEPAKPQELPPPVVKTTLRAPPQVAIGDTFVVTLDADAAAPLRGGQLKLAYAKERLQLLDVQEGDLLRQGGAATVFSRTIDAAKGEAQAGVLRSEASGVKGSATLLQLRFRALSAGDAEVRLAEFQMAALGERGAVHQAAETLRIKVTP